eukprot:8745835-Alexandrium_andersonii.AAC.1
MAAAERGSQAGTDRAGGEGQDRRTRVGTQIQKKTREKACAEKKRVDKVLKKTSCEAGKTRTGQDR